MALEVQLLGQQGLLRDGEPVRLSGRKSWGLLAYLVLEPHPTRREVAARIVPGANDPLAALRWLLHQLRRSLEPEATIIERDGQLQLELVGQVSIDLLELLDVPEDVEVIERLVRGELLEGMDFEDAPAFELWLSLQRTRVHDVIAEALWWIGSRIGTTDPARALRITERALMFDPFCETTNELLLDLLVQSGNAPVARQRYLTIERRFRTELGVPPSETVRRPLDRPRIASAVPPDVSAPALLESAAARLRAGELDRAVDTARRAADVALALEDPRIELAALLLLAKTLVHSHRGRDQEAKGLLSRALQLAGDLDDLAALADVECEMGYVFAMEGTGALAEPVLARAVEHAIAAGEPSRAARAQTYLGMCQSDRCDYERAEGTLSAAVAGFTDAKQSGWRGYAEAMLARARLRSGDAVAATRLAEEALRDVRRGGWRAVLPWPLIIQGDCARTRGHPDVARTRYSEALAYATESGDPCYEALALRGIAVLESRRDVQAAVDLLTDALSCCRRYQDVYPWARAIILTDLVELQDGTDQRTLDEAHEWTALGPLPDLAERIEPYRRRRTGPGGAGRGRQTPLQTVAS